LTTPPLTPRSGLGDFPLAKRSLVSRHVGFLIRSTEARQGLCRHRQSTAEFATKPALATKMLKRLMANHGRAAMSCFTADERYGDNPGCETGSTTKISTGDRRVGPLTCPSGLPTRSGSAGGVRVSPRSAGLCSAGWWPVRCRGQRLDPWAPTARKAYTPNWIPSGRPIRVHQAGHPATSCTQNSPDSCSQPVESFPEPAGEPRPSPGVEREGAVARGLLCEKYFG